MPTTKMLKRRLASVATTKKIMKAMSMVAAAKLQKDKARLLAARPFLEEMEAMAGRLRNNQEAMENPFFRPRKVNHTVYFVVTSDRGLCGGYNANVLSKAAECLREGKKASVIVAGQKGYEYFSRQGTPILQRYDEVLETSFYEDAYRIGGDLARLYTEGGADEIHLIYTRFESALTHTPRVERLLPIAGAARRAGREDPMRYEPCLGDFLERVAPVYLGASIYAALLESSACEQAVRMVSMEAAVNNASDIEEKLTRVYNRRRQAAITQELSELVASTRAGSRGGQQATRLIDKGE